MTSTIIAYWGEEKEVLYAYADDKGDCSTRHGAMRSFIVHGHVTEILEYYPYVTSQTMLNDRCDYWREQLKGLGYDMYE